MKLDSNPITRFASQPDNLKVVLLSPSDAWRSALEFHLLRLRRGLKLVCAVDQADFRAELQSGDAALALVELRVDDLVAQCQWVRQMRAQHPSVAWFAISAEKTQPWSRLLRVSGFTDVCSNFSQIIPFVERMGSTFAQQSRCLQIGVKDSTLETIIANQLPWRPISSMYAHTTVVDSNDPSDPT